MQDSEQNDSTDSINILSPNQHVELHWIKALNN